MTELAAHDPNIKVLIRNFSGWCITYTSDTDSLNFWQVYYETVDWYYHRQSTDITTDSRPIFRRQSMVNVSAECWPLYKQRYLPTVSRYVDHHSADVSVDILVNMSTDISRLLYRSVSVDMSTNISVECRLICRPIHQSGVSWYVDDIWVEGARNTHDPN